MKNTKKSLIVQVYHLVSPLQSIIYAVGMAVFAFVSMCLCETYIYVTYSDSSLAIAIKYFHINFTCVI